MAPILEKAFDMRAFVSHEHTARLGHVKGGAQRIIVPSVPEGSFLRGSGIDADVIPAGGADWLLLDAEAGIAHLDVRIAYRTKEGDSIYMHYPGIIKMDEKMALALSWSPDMKSTKSSDHYFFTTPTVEVSNPNHKWMEQTVFVAHGHWHIPSPHDGRQGVECEIYKLVSA